MSADNSSPFGALLKQERLAAGLTQEALAERAGLSVRAISDLERGVNRAPRQETLDLLIQALALSPRKRVLLLTAARPDVDPAVVGEPLLRPPHNLPIPPTPLIGREQDLTRAATLLTLTGPSGVGKTRLGFQLAEESLERFEDGVCFVALAPISDHALVVLSIAQTLGLRETTGQAPREQLKSYLRGKQVLLLLDNFEQVAPAAPVVAELLSACPRLKVLVTSRAPLHLRGEQELAVAPLAQAVKPDLALTADITPTIAAICERLDGLPLAIELAAARIRVLSPQILLERLTSRLPLLKGGAWDLPERQRTMRDAIAWSYELLDPGGQRLFRRLAVFAGGWTLAAAETICGETDERAPGSMLEDLAALGEKSLLYTETPGGMPLRFSMLEIIREYALERLQASDEAEALRRRHAAYYAHLVEDPLRMGPTQDARDEELARESANARAAMEWARACGEYGLGLQVATGFARLWYFRGMISEGQGWLEQFLALDAVAGERAAASVRIVALYGASRFVLDQGNYDRAEALAREALALAQRIEDHSGKGNALALLGVVAEARGDLTRATSLLEESLFSCRQAGDTGAIVRALMSLGHIAAASGDDARARAYFEEALAHTRALGITWGVAAGLTSLGHLARKQGDYHRARELYQESLTLHRRLGNKVYAAWCLEGLAAAASAEGQVEYAAYLCAAAAALREAVGAPLPPAEQDHYDRTVAAVHAALGDELFKIAWAAGRKLSLEEAITYALADDAEQ